jgi:replicative DNA helicase
MMIDSDCIKAVAAKLREEDFSLALNGVIFRTISEMELAGRPVDPLTVADALREAKAGDEKANRRYLAQLLEITPTAAYAEEYAGIVLDRAKRRNLRQALQSGLDQLDSDEAAETVTPAIEAALTANMERSAGDLLTPAEQVSKFYQRREQIDADQQPYVRTGFRQLDKQLGGGMQNSGLYFLAARPGMGKTTLALNVAEWVARTTGAVLFVSLEMDPEQVTTKRVAAIAKLPYQIVLSDRLTDQEYKRVSEAVVEIGRTPLIVNAGATATVGQIVSMARARKDLRLVVVDHFSLIQTPDRQDRVQAYTAVSNQLKRLARTLRIPVLVLAQLNRANEQRADKRPMLSDLRETGAA